MLSNLPHPIDLNVLLRELRVQTCRPRATGQRATGQCACCDVVFVRSCEDTTNIPRELGTLSVLREKASSTHEKCVQQLSQHMFCTPEVTSSAGEEVDKLVEMFDERLLSAPAALLSG